MNGLLAFGSFAAYSASKFAVTGLSDAIRDEFAPFGIGVSVLFPGLTRSLMSLADIESGQIPREGLESKMMEPIWLGRMEVQAIEQNERSEEHTAELQSLMHKSYAVVCLKKK